VPQDYAKAREWYGKAVKGDNPFAYYDLAYLYKNGLNGLQDLDRLRKLYKKMQNP